MMRIRTVVLTGAVAVGSLGVVGGSAAAAPPPCPAADELWTLSQLEAFVEEAGGETGDELTAFFELVDENQDGLACFMDLPEATPFPTPPLLGSDNRLPRS